MTVAVIVRVHLTKDDWDERMKQWKYVFEVLPPGFWPGVLEEFQAVFMREMLMGRKRLRDIPGFAWVEEAQDDKDF